MNRTPADELARLTAEFVSGLVDLDDGPRILDITDPDDVARYLLVMLHSVLPPGDVDPRQHKPFQEAGKRLILLAKCENHLVASRAYAMLHASAEDWGRGFGSA